MSEAIYLMAVQAGLPDANDRLANIAARLDRYAIRFERLDDSRCVFTHLDARLTWTLAHELAQGQWRDAGWVVRLAEAFSQRYLAAVDAFDAESREMLE